MTLKGVLLAALIAAGEAGVYEHLKGKFTGETALGFKQWVGNPPPSPSEAIRDCVWRWNNEDETSEYVRPVWECPHCSEDGQAVFFPTGLRRCPGQTVTTLEQLNELTEDCDWISGGLIIEVAASIVLANVTRVTGILVLGDQVANFSAPKLTVVKGLEIRGTSMTVCSVPALVSICAGSLTVAPSSKMTTFSAPMLGDASSFELVVEGIKVDLSLDLGSVGGGPSVFLNRFVLSAISPSKLRLSGLRNLRAARLEPVWSSMRMKGVMVDPPPPTSLLPGGRGLSSSSRAAPLPPDARPCPLHGAIVEFTRESLYPIGDFIIEDTEYTHCSPKLSTTTVWAEIRIVNNPLLREANIPAQELTRGVTVVDNPSLRVDFEHLQRVGRSVVVRGRAPPPPHNVIKFPHLEAVGESIIIEPTSNVTVVDIGSAKGGPAALKGTLSLSCQLSCGELRGLTRLSVVDSRPAPTAVNPAQPAAAPSSGGSVTTVPAVGADYVRFEGFENVGRIPTADTLYRGNKVSLSFIRNNWQWIYFHRARLTDMWDILKVHDNPYLESLQRPINYNRDAVTSITITSNPLLPQACAGVDVWEKPIVQSGNHPDATLVCTQD